jgi:hypothetical protein
LAVRPRTIIALVLFMIGMGIVLYGLGAAVMELVGLYSSALNDPLADSPRGEARGVSDRMVRDVIIGGIGVVPLLVGSVMLKMGFFGFVRKMLFPEQPGKTGEQPRGRDMSRK